MREMVDDLIYALRWCELNAEKYYIDLDNFFMAGDSAGGQLALLCTAIMQSEKLQRIYREEIVPSLSVKGLFLTSPVHDMMMFAHPNNPVCKEFAVKIFGADYENSPYIHCSSFKQIADEVTLPPVFLTSAQQDIFRGQSIKFEALLKKYGVTYKFIFLKRNSAHKYEHAFNMLYPDWDESKKLNGLAANFFKNIMSGKIK